MCEKQPGNKYYLGNISLFPIDMDHWAAVVILTWRKSRISKMLLMIGREDSSDAGTLMLDSGGCMGFLWGEEQGWDHPRKRKWNLLHSHPSMSIATISFDWLGVQN